MGDKSKIEWTDASWNAIIARHKKTGKKGWFCTKPSNGCKLCYAESFNKRLGTGLPYTVSAMDEIDIVLDEKKLLLPLHWKKPRRIFVNSMSDLFHEAVPDEFIDRVFAAMAHARRHTFQILTKRPDRMLCYMTYWPDGAGRVHHVRHHVINLQYRLDGVDRSAGWSCNDHSFQLADKVLPLESWPLPNVHLGVSCEDQPTADERIPELLRTPAAVRFVSLEPLLSGLNIKPYLQAKFPMRGVMNGNAYQNSHDTNKLDWVIVGGESGPNARPCHPDWIRSLCDQCVAAGVPYFFKQWGAWKPISEMPESEYQKLYVSNRVAKEHEDQGRIDELLGRACKVETGMLQFDGKFGAAMIDGKPAYLSFKVGKKAAGAMLDGREWKEFPTFKDIHQ